MEVERANKNEHKLTQLLFIMKIQSISIGSWFPKTSIHAYELIGFLKQQTVSNGLDPKHAAVLHGNLSPQQVQLVVKDGVKCVQGIAESYEFQYAEDGLLVMRGTDRRVLGEVSAQEARDRIQQFYRERFAPVLSYLYSRGAKGLEILRMPGSGKRVFICASNVTAKDLDDLFGSTGYNERVIGKLRAYVGDEFILVEQSKGITQRTIDAFIGNAIFYSEVKKHADALLQIHRSIWDDAEKLVDYRSTKASSLLAINEKLASHAKRVDTIQSRIAQMQLNIDYRKQIMQENKQAMSLGSLGELNHLLKYMQNVFIMTEKYIQTNITGLSARYNEAQQTLLNRLQFLFLIGVVVSFLTLGAFPGANFTFVGPTGELIASGTMVSFDLRTLVVFGLLATLITLLIAAGWTMLLRERIRKPR
jgi:hypothetical protein